MEQKKINKTINIIFVILSILTLASIYSASEGEPTGALYLLIIIIFSVLFLVKNNKKVKKNEEFSKKYINTMGVISIIVFSIAILGSIITLPLYLSGMDINTTGFLNELFDLNIIFDIIFMLAFSVLGLVFSIKMLNNKETKNLMIVSGVFILGLLTSNIVLLNTKYFDSAFGRMINLFLVAFVLYGFKHLERIKS